MAIGFNTPSSDFTPFSARRPPLISWRERRSHVALAKWLRDRRPTQCLLIRKAPRGCLLFVAGLEHFVARRAVAGRTLSFSSAARSASRRGETTSCVWPAACRHRTSVVRSSARCSSRTFAPMVIRSPFLTGIRNAPPQQRPCWHCGGFAVDHRAVHQRERTVITRRCARDSVDALGHQHDSVVGARPRVHNVWGETIFPLATAGVSDFKECHDESISARELVEEKCGRESR